MLSTAPLRRFGRSVARVTHTRYPAFLFGADLPRGEIPVFTYHDVTAAELTGDLQFLLMNGYRTLDIEEFHRRMSSGRASDEKLVLLTFDDARRSFWEVAYPLLAAYRMRATLFVPSYWIADPARMFMTWHELRLCERSGTIDVESHAHRHALVYREPRLAGFASPAALARHDLFDWPMRREPIGDQCGFPPLGTPIYESAPLLSTSRRMLEPAAAVAACRQLVERHGAPAFFALSDWPKRLRAAHDRAAARQPATWLSDDALRELVAHELQRALEHFERELGRKPRYFAYPWMLGSPDSQRELHELGVTAAFGVALDFHAVRRERTALPCYGRFKADWLRFLPGYGRRRLRDVVPQKLASFTHSQHLAH